MKFQKHNPTFTKEWRRQLRANATPAEKELWSWLRDRRFHGYRWHRQYGVWKYVLDFYCHIAKLAIELDGSIHDLLDKKTHDFDKDAYLQSVGIRVLHFSNEQIFNDRQNVEKTILNALTA